MPCADVKRCWQQGQQLWQHSCSSDACRYLGYRWCLLRCTFESRQPVLETKGKVKRQTTKRFFAYGYGGGRLWIWLCLLLHQLRNTSDDTHIPEFPNLFQKKRFIFSTVYHHPDHKIFSLWVGFTTILIQAGGNKVCLAIRFCKDVGIASLIQCWVCVISHTTCWEKRQLTGWWINQGWADNP